ncbi:MAG: response regulator [Myxococcota bacterium]|nr:response regulator [Deltaproteobacteria bacterium]MDQ3339074.1 response regulator [Myxococcota bacterium]
MLVVDDDADQRLVMRGILESAGYQVLEAANGRDALDMCRAVKPSIVLLDAVMPIMNGDTFLRHKQIDDDIMQIPVVMVTAALDVNRARRVAAILRKPTRQRAVVDAVRSFARLSHAA